MKQILLAITLVAITSTAQADSFGDAYADTAVQVAIEKGTDITIQKLQALHSCYSKEMSGVPFSTSQMEAITAYSDANKACTKELNALGLVPKF